MEDSNFALSRHAAGTQPLHHSCTCTTCLCENHERAVAAKGVCTSGVVVASRQRGAKGRSSNPPCGSVIALSKITTGFSASVPVSKKPRVFLPLSKKTRDILTVAKKHALFGQWQKKHALFGQSKHCVWCDSLLESCSPEE